MKKLMRDVFAGLFAMAMGASQASAVVLDFNQYAHDPIGSSPFTDVLFVGPTLIDKGFKIESCGFGYCGADGLGVFSRNHIWQPDQGQASVSFWNSNTVVLTRQDGSVFDFYSIDLAAQQSNAEVFAEVSWSVLSGGGDVQIVSFNDDPAPGVKLSTVVFDVHGVTSVKLRTITDRFQFDNIVLNYVPPVSEPTSLVLLALGLVGLGAIRRRAPA